MTVNMKRVAKCTTKAELLALIEELSQNQAENEEEIKYAMSCFQQLDHTCEITPGYWARN